MKSAALSLPSDSNMSSFPSISKVCRVLRRVSSFANFLPILPSSLPPCLQLLASPKPLLLKWRMHCPNMSHWLLPVLLPLLEPDFQLKGCWNLTFSSNWENSWHPRFLQILNLHFYIFIFISGSDPILTADICLDVIFVFLSIIIYIWIWFSKSICICIPSQGTNDSVLAVDRPRPPGRHSRRHYWDAIVQPPALCVQPAPKNMLKRPHDWNPGTLCFPLYVQPLEAIIVRFQSA